MRRKAGYIILKSMRCISSVNIAHAARYLFLSCIQSPNTVFFQNGMDQFLQKSAYITAQNVRLNQTEPA